MLTPEQIAEGWVEPTELAKMVGYQVLYRNAEERPVSASMRTATRNTRCSLTSPAATLPRAGSATSSANVTSLSPDRERRNDPSSTPIGR